MAAIQTGAVGLNGLRDGMRSMKYFHSLMAAIVVAVNVGLPALFLLALSSPPAVSIGGNPRCTGDGDLGQGPCCAAGQPSGITDPASPSGCGPLIAGAPGGGRHGTVRNRQGPSSHGLASQPALTVGGPAALGALSSAVGSCYLAGGLREMASIGMGVLLNSPRPLGGAHWMLLDALLVAVPGTLVLRSKVFGSAARPAPS